MVMDAGEKFERKLNMKEPSTKRNYRSAFNKFLAMQGLTADEFVSLAEKDLGEVELRVQEAMKAEKDAGKRPTTAYMIYKAVKFFLRSAGVKDFSLDAEDKPRMIYNGSRKVTREQIRQLWDGFSANYKVRNRAILLFLKDSGIRISDLAKLNVEQYLTAREVTERGERFKVFKASETEKTGDFAHIHIGPEAVKAVEEYLGDRKTGPLFVSEKGGRMCSKAVSELFRTVRVRGRVKGDFSKISAHSFRKFHYTTLHMRDEWILWLEGKAVSVYTDDPEVTQAYIKDYDSLRVFGADASREEVERLQADLDREKESREELLRMVQEKVIEPRRAEKMDLELEEQHIIELMRLQLQLMEDQVVLTDSEETREKLRALVERRRDVLAEYESRKAS